jgi:uncharacterized membrane protein
MGCCIVKNFFAYLSRLNKRINDMHRLWIGMFIALLLFSIILTVYSSIHYDKVRTFNIGLWIIYSSIHVIRSVVKYRRANQDKNDQHSKE